MFRRATLPAGSLAAASLLAVTVTCQSSRMKENRVLADKHRVVLIGWPIKAAVAAQDPRAHTLDALFGYLAEAGYDGCELTTRDFKTLYFDAERTSSVHVIREVNAAAPQRLPYACGKR